MAAHVVAEPTAEAMAYKSAWRETRDLCPTDRYIRSHGFTIAARCGINPAKWERREMPGRPGYSPLDQATVIEVIAREIQATVDRAATK